MLTQYSCMSQTYTIPWATKQPAWVFPIWVEDASGAKDTVYIGYEKTVSSNGCHIDSGYGEELFFIPPNTTNFYLNTCQIPIDSVHKAEVVSNVPGLPYGATLFFNNVIFPIVVKWDRSLLNSDSLPFPSLAPAPRAQLVILAWVANNIIPACGSDPIVAADSCLCCCCQPDSVIIESDFNGIPISSVITCLIMPWVGYFSNTLDYSNEKFLSVSPNPSSGHLKINSEKIINDASYWNVMGVRKNIGQNFQQIDVNMLSRGIYFFQFEIDAKMYFKKVVVVE